MTPATAGKLGYHGLGRGQGSVIFEAEDFIRAHSLIRGQTSCLRHSPNHPCNPCHPWFPFPPSFPSVGHFFLQKIAKTAKVPEFRIRPSSFVQPSPGYGLASIPSSFVIVFIRDIRVIRGCLG